MSVYRKSVTKALEKLIEISEWINKDILKKNNWRSASKKDVKNKELWQQLDNLVHLHEVQWHWVKGHSGNVENDRCDVLAVKARMELAKSS